MKTTDIIETIFTAKNTQLMSAFSQLEKRADSFQRKMAKAEGLSRFNSKLKEAGMHLGKHGQIYAANRRGAISQAEAMKRITEESQRQARLAADRKAFIAMPGGMEDMSNFQRMGESLGRMSRQGINVNTQLAEMRKRLGANKEMMNAFNQGVVQGKKYFDMFNLSLLFGGMMMRRAGMNVLRFMIPSMDKLQKLNTEGAKKVMGMSAAFEFLKISMFETIAQTPMFKAFIEGAVKLAMWLSEVAQKHPTLAAVVALLSTLAVGVGTAGIILGGLGNIGTMFSGAYAVIKKWIGADGTGGKFGKAFDGLKKAAGIALVVSAGLDLYNAMTNEKTESWGSILMTAIKAGLGAGLLFNPATGIITGLTVAAVMTVKNLMDMTEINNQLAKFSPDASTFNMGVPVEEDGITKWTGQQEFAYKTMQNFAQEYNDQLEEQAQLQKKVQDAITNSTNPSELARLQLAYKEVNDKISEMEQIANSATQLDKYKELNNIIAQTKIEFESQLTANQNAITLAEKEAQKIKEKEDAIKGVKDMSAEVTPEIIQNYADQYAEQLKSDEGLAALQERMTAFGTTVSEVIGDNKSGVISNFFNFGKEILVDEFYFNRLKKDINDWIVPEKTLTIRAKYVGFNSNNGGEPPKSGLFGTIGDAIDTTVDAVKSSLGSAGE